MQTLATRLREGRSYYAPAPRHQLAILAGRAQLSASVEDPDEFPGQRVTVRILGPGGDKPPETVEPLKSDLDVAELKAQVLERIETLEEQERERQEILSGLIPAMEARGYDAGAVKAVVGR